jgi:hypothetical protein
MHVLEAAVFSTLVNSPRKALLDYPASEWREIQELLDAAIDKPTPAEAVRAKPTLSELFRRWLTGSQSRNCPPARNVAWSTGFHRSGRA